ncbi:histone-lysine N-methyltransferase trr [Drosophila willistoni]|uniref:histone-lysine N-methyltransferase trr n=1 Tax=Drosophila willistoni TaxID=7260 RepID=UPI00017D7C3E|nr:histone-lysine N-methyltransferase trr [Drosophila willistoni]
MNISKVTTSLAAAAAAAEKAKPERVNVNAASATAATGAPTGAVGVSTGGATISYQTINLQKRASVDSGEQSDDSNLNRKKLKTELIICPSPAKQQHQRGPGGVSVVSAIHTSLGSSSTSVNTKDETASEDAWDQQQQTREEQQQIIVCNFGSSTATNTTEMSAIKQEEVAEGNQKQNFISFTKKEAASSVAVTASAVSSSSSSSSSTASVISIEPSGGGGGGGPGGGGGTDLPEQSNKFDPLEHVTTTASGTSIILNTNNGTIMTTTTTNQKPGQTNYNLFNATSQTPTLLNRVNLHSKLKGQPLMMNAKKLAEVTQTTAKVSIGNKTISVPLLKPLITASAAGGATIVESKPMQQLPIGGQIVTTTTGPSQQTQQSQQQQQQQTQHINYTKLLKRGPKNPTTIVSFSGLQIKPANTKIVTAKVVSKKMSLQYQQQHQQQQQQQQQQLQIQQQQSTGSLAPPTGSIVTITTTNPNQTYTMVQQQPQQQDTPSTGGVANSLSGGDAVDAVDTNPRQKPTYSENIQKILYKSKSLESAGSNEEFTNINSVVIKPLDKSQLNCGSGFNIFKATPATSNSSVVTSSTSSGVVELPSASSASASSSGATTTSTSVSVSAILNEVAVAKSTPATICINSPAVGGGSRPIISIQKNISLVLSKSSMAQQKAKMVTTQSGASVVGSTIQMHTVPLQQQQQQQTLQQSSDQTLSDQSTKSSMQIKLTPQTLTTTAIATSSTIVAATSVASTTTTTPTKLNVSQVTKLEELSADNKTKMIIKHQQQQQQQNQVNVQDSTPSNSSSITSTTTSSSSSGGTTNATIKEQQQQSDQHNDAVLPVVAPAPAPVVTAPVAPTPPNNGQAQRVDDSNNALLKQLLQNSSSSHNLSQISITSSHVSASGPSGGGAGGVNASSTASLSARKVINVRAPSMGLVSSLEAQLARPVIPPVPAAVSNSSSNNAGGVVTSTATPSTPTTTTTATTLNQSGAPSITANPMASDQQKQQQQQPAVVKTEQQQPQGPPPPPPPLPSPQTHHPSHTHQTLSLPPPSSSSASSSSSSQQQLQLKQSVQIVSKETSFISTPHLVPVTTPLIDSTTKTEQILPPPPSYELATSSSSSSTNSTTISAPVSNVTISVSTKPIAIDQTQENESSHAGDSVPSTDQQMVVMEQQQQATQQPQQQQQQHSSTSWKLPEQLNHQANVQLEQQQQQQPNHIIKILGVEVQKRKHSMQLPLEEKQQQQQQQQQLLPPPQQQHQHHAVSPVTPSSQEKVQLITGYAKKTLSNQQQSITPDMPLHQQQTTAQLHHLQQQQQAIIHHPQEPPAKPGDQRKRRKRENVQKSRRGNLNAGTPTGLGASAGGTNLKDFPIGGLMPGGNIVGTTTLPSGAVVQMATGGGLANTTAAYMQGGHPNAVGHHPAMVSNAAAAAAAASIGNSGSSPMLKKRVRKYSKVEEDHDAFTEKLMTHIKQMQPLQVLEPLLNRNFLIGCSDLGPAVASNSSSGASGGASGGGKAKSSTSGSTSGGGAGAYSRGGWPLLMRGGDDTEQLGANCKFGQVRHPSLPSLYDSERFGGHSPSLPPPGPLGGNKSLSTIQNDFYDQEFSTHLERNPRERLVRHIGAVRDSQTETIELVEQPQPLIATLPRLTRYPGLILLNNTSRCHGIAGGRMSPVALSEDFTTLRLPISPVLRSCAEELRKSQHLEMGGPAGGSHNNNNNNNNYQQKNQNVILSLHSSASDNIVGVLRDLANLLHLTPSPGISCRVIDDKSTLEKTTTDATPEAGAAAAPAAGEDGGGGSDTEGNRERISQSHLRKILMGRRKICRGCDSAIAAFGIRVPKDEQSPEDKPSPRLAQLQALLPGYVPQPAYDYFCSRTCLTKHKWSTTSTSGGQQTDSTASTKPSALAKMKLSASASPDELQSKINEIPTAKRKCIVKCFSADCFGPATTAAEDSKGAVPPNNTVWETGDSGQQQQLEDTRQCVFCNQRGDGLADGPSRLLNFDVDKWVHLNCALWSNGVYETVSGALMNFQIALQAGLNQSCSACHLLGATIKCFKSRCNAIYHLPCAIKEDCMFYKNKSVHCSAHAAAASSIGGSSGGSGSNSVSGSSGSGSAMATGGGAADNELSSFIVHRRVFVDRDENRQVATVMHYSELSNLLRVGNMTFLNVGQLLPHQLEAFHTPHHIYPIGYKVSRYYWCLRRPNRRCRYICSIAEAGCRPEFRILVQDTGDKAEPDREFRDSTPTAVWQQILQPIQRLRKVHKWLQLFPQHISGEDLFGLTEPAIVRILESLPGIETLTDYRFKYGRNPLLEFPLAINPSGAARTEPKQRQLLVWRKPHTQRTAGSCSSTQRMANSAAIAGEVACPYSKQFVHSKSSQYKKMKQEWRNNVYLARSKIQGLGLYAARDIEKHTMIIEYIGEVIRTEVSEIREKQYEAKNRGIYMFRLDEDRVVDATLSGGLARYINHSCNPNCVTEIVEVDRDVRIIIFAKRKIYRGEELSYDYKFDIEDESHKIPCACGAPNCRKWMN